MHLLSIHAPAQGATVYRPLESQGNTVFQSTLPHRERQIARRPLMRTWCFQSTLPHRERQWGSQTPSLSCLHGSIPRTPKKTDDFPLKKAIITCQGACRAHCEASRKIMCTSGSHPIRSLLTLQMTCLLCTSISAFLQLPPKRSDKMRLSQYNITPPPISPHRLHTGSFRVPSK